jgi:hypothetical protein
MMTAQVVIAGHGSIPIIAVPKAATAICRKPRSADAEPACAPNGSSVRAVPIGLTVPMPRRKRLIASRKGKPLGVEAQQQCDAPDKGDHQSRHSHAHDAETRRQPRVGKPATEDDEDRASEEQAQPRRVEPHPPRQDGRGCSEKVYKQPIMQLTLNAGAITGASARSAA